MTSDILPHMKSALRVKLIGMGADLSDRNLTELANAAIIVVARNVPVPEWTDVIDAAIKMPREAKPNLPLPE